MESPRGIEMPIADDPLIEVLKQGRRDGPESEREAALKLNEWYRQEDAKVESASSLDQVGLIRRLAHIYFEAGYIAQALEVLQYIKAQLAADYALSSEAEQAMEGVEQDLKEVEALGPIQESNVNMELGFIKPKLEK